MTTFPYIYKMMTRNNPHPREEIEWIIEQSAKEINSNEYTYYSGQDYHGLKSNELGHGLVNASVAVMAARNI